MPWVDDKWPTMAEMADRCFESCDSGPGSAEDPRWCDCEKGRPALEAIYGNLPAVTYQPGWLFRWSCANGLLFLHCIVGEPNCKGFDSVTGAERGPTDWMWVTELPLNHLWLLRHIAQMENHERREWFKIDGVAPLYPHCRHDGDVLKRVPGRALCAQCESWYDEALVPAGGGEGDV